jgi:hypothetical protein
MSAEPLPMDDEEPDAGEPEEWLDDPARTAVGDALLDRIAREHVAQLESNGATARRNVHGSGVVPAEAWPTPPADEAYHGLAGDVVRTIEPYSEADPVALLLQLLTAWGSLVGRGPHIRVEADEHPSRLYAVLVGDTSRGRKGTSLKQIRRICVSVDESFPERIESGLSSGEGLIDRVRDTETDEPPDKRLLIVESELASVLKVVERQGNNLSPVVRAAWDGDTLATLTRNTRARATETHISIIGHITIEEVRRRLDQTEAVNGFANRFIWIATRRSKELPDGGTPPQLELNQLATRLRDSLDRTRKIGTVQRDQAARQLWTEVYGDLTAGGHGLAGALTSRAEAQVTRLSLLYALLEQADAICEEHLRSALALWDYSARSVLHIFGDNTGNPDTDTILRALRASPGGLTRSEIRDLFGRHLPSNRLDQALGELLERGLAHFTREASGGRPIERWHAGRPQ